MTTPSRLAQSKLLVELLRSVSRMQPRPVPPHLCEDEELLACWSAGLLGSTEQQAIVDHLAACPHCRAELAQLVRSGAVELTNSDLNEATSIPITPPLRVARRRWVWVAGTLAAAAAILIAVYFWPDDSRQSTPGGAAEARLVSLENQARAGEPLQALDGVEKLIDTGLSAELEPRARALAESAGYQAAQAALLAGNFEDVEALERRVTARGEPSARIRNLALQAERGLRAELALTEVGDLMSYGYGLDGWARGKSLPTIGQGQQRLHEAYRTARSNSPREPRVLLNYGQFLLTIADFEGARRLFEAAREIDRTSAAAHLGLGLAAYETQDFTAALSHFEAAIKAEPDNLNAHLNAAICLERLGRAKDADPFWETVLAKTPDRTLRQRIETHRRSRTAPLSPP